MMARLLSVGALVALAWAAPLAQAPLNPTPGRHRST